MERWIIFELSYTLKVLTCVHIVITVRKAKQSADSLVKTRMHQIAKINIFHRIKVFILHVAANWHTNFNLFQVKVSPGTMTLLIESERLFKAIIIAWLCVQTRW